MSILGSDKYRLITINSKDGIAVQQYRRQQHGDHAKFVAEGQAKTGIDRKGLKELFSSSIIGKPEHVPTLVVYDADPPEMKSHYPVGMKEGLNVPKYCKVYTDICDAKQKYNFGESVGYWLRAPGRVFYPASGAAIKEPYLTQVSSSYDYLGENLLLRDLENDTKDRRAIPVLSAVETYKGDREDHLQSMFNHFDALLRLDTIEKSKTNADAQGEMFARAVDLLALPYVRDSAYNALMLRELKLLLSVLGDRYRLQEDRAEFKTAMSLREMIEQRSQADQRLPLPSKVAQELLVVLDQAATGLEAAKTRCVFSAAL